MRGTGWNSKGYTIKAVVQSDSTEYKPGELKGLLILAAGNLALVDGEGTSRTIVFPAAADGGCYPFLLELDIRKVMDTNTTLTDANMMGVH